MLSKYKRRLLQYSATALLSLTSTLSHANMPYDNQAYDYKQPNGETIKVFVTGNIYFAEQRTADGRLLTTCANAKGLCYAKLSADQTAIISTGVLATSSQSANTKQALSSIANRIEVPNELKKRIARDNYRAMEGEELSNAQDQLSDYAHKAKVVGQKAVTGTITGLTLLVSFPEEAATITKEQVESYVNDVGYTGFSNAHSIRDYFLTVSDNQLDYTNIVSPYIQARNAKSYYNDETIGFGIRARELVNDALADLETQGFDFTPFTLKNGKIQAINVFYVGVRNVSFAKGLWPHKSSGLSFCGDGVCANEYQMTDMTSELSVGTFIHESGHLVMGWPDLYDTDGSSNGSIASFGLMGFGGLKSKRPMMPVGVLRFLAGWSSVTELNPSVNTSAPSGTLSIQPNTNTFYKWSNPARLNDEAFYIDSIYTSGQNTGADDTGLAIWHHDTAGNSTNEDKPLIQMEHADGNRDPENSVNRGDATDLYDAVTGDAFTFNKPNSTAATSQGTNSRWSDNSASGLSISNISAASASTMTFTVSVGAGSSGGSSSGGSSGGSSSGGSSSGGLSNGQQVSGLGASQNTFTAAYYIDVPTGASDLTFDMQPGSGSTGDADLFVKKGSVPTDSSYDCRPWDNGSAEICGTGGDTLVTSEGRFYFNVRAYSTFTNVNVRVTYTGGGSSSGGSSSGGSSSGGSSSGGSSSGGSSSGGSSSGGSSSGGSSSGGSSSGGLTNGQTVTGLGATQDTFTSAYYIDVPAGASNLAISIAAGTGATGDADLFVKKGSEPTDSSYDCRPWDSGSAETCGTGGDTLATSEGRFYIKLRAYSTFTNVTLTASFTGGGSSSGGSSSGGSSSGGSSSGGSSSGGSVIDACASESAHTASAVTANDAICLTTGTGSNSIAYHYVNVPANTSSMTIKTAHGTGNGNLYYNASTWATASANSQSSTASGNTESITVSNPASGNRFFSVTGQQAGMALIVEIQ